MPTPKKNIPQADHLMGSMRSMGYTFEAAIADIIDNSISAECTEVHMYFPTDPLQCFVAILDDGLGMSSTELFNAMRYGSTASEKARSEKDLGRFGLGMKAASLSQCRKLTVVSKQSKNGQISAYSWDYSYILEHGDWYLLELTPLEISLIPKIEALQAQDRGTLVIWEDFDIIDKSSNGQVYHTLCEYKEKINKYVGLIFHRYISAPPAVRVTMYLNHNKISALDPFLENHIKTTRKKEFTISLPDSDGVERYIKVRPFILPFIKELSDRDIEKLGGAENLKTKQGFYIYRNNRLIIWGTWFGLQKAELTKNARIRVDIPNTLDDIWSIDIKKSNAAIPKSVQNSLKRAVSEAMEFSVRQHVYRGRLENEDDVDRLWNRLRGREDAFYYEVNRESKMYKLMKEHISEEDLPYIEMYLQELESNIPIYRMYLDQASNSVTEKDPDGRPEEVYLCALSMLDSHLLFGAEITKESVEKLFQDTEPFCSYPAVKSKVLAHYDL